MIKIQQWVFIAALFVVKMPQIVFAQSAAPGSKEFAYVMGTPYKVINAEEKYYFSEGTDIISIKIDGKDFFIQKFDGKSLNQVSVAEVEDLPKGFYLEGFMKVPGHVLCFYSIVDKATKKDLLYCRSIDFSTGTFAPAPELLHTRQNVYSKTEFYLSADSSKVMAKYRLKPEFKDDSKNIDVIGFAIYAFDNGMKMLWSKEVKMPYTEKKMHRLGYAVDSDGNAYMLAKVFLDNSTRELSAEKLSNFRFEVLKVDAATQELKGTKIDLEGKYITNVSLQETHDGFITLNGYFNFMNKEKDLDIVEGVFQCKLSKEGVLGEFRTYNIPEDILNQDIGTVSDSSDANKEFSEDKSIGMGSLYLDKVKRYKDGSSLLFGEQFYTWERTYKDMQGNYQTRTSYHFNNILLTKINANGELAWMRKLRKRQSGGLNPGGMSYRHFQSGNYHYLLFLDHIKNIDLPPDKMLFNHVDGSGGYLTAYKVDDTTGKASRISIFNIKDVNGTEIFQFMPGRLIQIGENEFVLEAYKKSKEDVLIKISGNGGVSE